MLGLLLLAFFVFTARLGFNGPDEGFYYTIPLRPLYVGTLAPYLYLSADLPCGDFSAWDEDQTSVRREAYWALFPAQKPGYIYLPDARVTALRAEVLGEDYLLMQMRELSGICTFEAVRGEGGYILRVTGDA
jgi:hypothetical protein